MNTPHSSNTTRVLFSPFNTPSKLWYAVIFTLLLTLAVSALSVEPTRASGLRYCAEFCRDKSLTRIHEQGQCLAVCTSRGGSQGIDLSAGESVDAGSTRVNLTGEQCIAVCGELFSVAHPTGSNDHIDAIRYLNECVQGCNPATLTDRGAEQTITELIYQKTADLQEQAQETAVVRNAQVRGLCVLKTELSKGEARSLLNRTISESRVTNVHLESLALNESERNTLCLYSSMKLIARYLLFMVGVTAVGMLMFAGLLWAESRTRKKRFGGIHKLLARAKEKNIPIARKLIIALDKTKEIDIIHRLITTALIGFVLILLSQVILRILRSLL